MLKVHADGRMQEQIAAPVYFLIPARQLMKEEMALVERLAIGAHTIRRAQLQRGGNRGHRCEPICLDCSIEVISVDYGVLIKESAETWVQKSPKGVPYSMLRATGRHWKQV